MLRTIITLTMKLLTRRGELVEEEGSTCLADNDADSDEARTLSPLHGKRSANPTLAPSMMAC